MRDRFLPAFILLTMLAACGKGDETRKAGIANETIVPDSEIDGVASAPGAKDGTNQTGERAPLDRLAGVGIGMSISDLRARGFEVTDDEGPDPDNSCGYARIKGLDDLFFMTEHDKVVRIDVATPGYPTLGGVAVGMSEAEALQRLGARAKVEPHPYTGPQGHYLIVHEEDAPFGLIVETDGKTVESYRIGRWEPVQWVEGCL